MASHDAASTNNICLALKLGDVHLPPAGVHRLHLHLLRPHVDRRHVHRHGNGIDDNVPVRAGPAVQRALRGPRGRACQPVPLQLSLQVYLGGVSFDTRQTKSSNLVLCVEPRLIQAALSVHETTGSYPSKGLQLKLRGIEWKALARGHHRRTFRGGIRVVGTGEPGVHHRGAVQVHQPVRGRACQMMPATSSNAFYTLFSGVKGILHLMM